MGESSTSLRDRAIHYRELALLVTDEALIHLLFRMAWESDDEAACLEIAASRAAQRPAIRLRA
jgi:ADP-heptose:LPS heptosyltransferase